MPLDTLLLSFSHRSNDCDRCAQGRKNLNVDLPEVVMKHLISAAATLLLGTIVAIQTANAEGWNTNTDNPSGGYVGAGWGRFDLHIENFDTAGATTTSITSSNDNAWKVFGGYRFNPFIAVEADYIDLGKPSDRFTATGSNGNYRVDLSGFAPYLVGTAPLGPIELFAKAGWFYYDVKTAVNFDSPAPGVSPGIESSHSHSDFTYGGGIGATLFNHLNISAEFDVLDIQNARNSNAVWLNAAWRF
jgi:opacity protein-like surface antigen